MNENKSLLEELQILSKQKSDGTEKWFLNSAEGMNRLKDKLREYARKGFLFVAAQFKNKAQLEFVKTYLEEEGLTISNSIQGSWRLYIFWGEVFYYSLDIFDFTVDEDWNLIPESKNE